MLLTSTMHQTNRSFNLAELFNWTWLHLPLVLDINFEKSIHVQMFWLLLSEAEVNRNCTSNKCEEQFHAGNLDLLNSLDSLTFLCLTSLPVLHHVSIIAPWNHTEARRSGGNVCKTRNCPFKTLDEGLRGTLKSFSEMLLDYKKVVTPAFRNPYHGH